MYSIQTLWWPIPRILMLWTDQPNQTRPRQIHLCGKGRMLKWIKDKSMIKSLKLNSYSNKKHFFIALLHAHFPFWGHEHLSIDQYQNAMSGAMPLQELKNSHDKILLVIWKRSAWSFIAKQWRLILNEMLAFEYEFRFRNQILAHATAKSINTKQCEMGPKKWNIASNY